jgi:hypothetical protein
VFVFDTVVLWKIQVLFLAKAQWREGKNVGLLLVDDHQRRKTVISLREIVVRIINLLCLLKPQFNKEQTVQECDATMLINVLMLEKNFLNLKFAPT